MRALGFEPVLYAYYDDSSRDDPPKGVILDELPGSYDVRDDESIPHLLHSSGGILLYQDGAEVFQDEYRSGHTEVVEWVTPVMIYNRLKEALVSYGYESSLDRENKEVCMSVRIGKAGDRLAYPTVAQVKKAINCCNWTRRWNDHW